MLSAPYIQSPLESQVFWRQEYYSCLKAPRRRHRFVKTIIERHGGEVGVVSSPEKGTRFWFSLPAASS